MRSVQVAVVGGGPAGLMAAIAARGAGAEVALFDEHPTFGGQLRYRATGLAGIVSPISGRAGLPPPALVAGLIGVAASSGVSLRPNAVVWGIFADNELGVSGPDGGDRVRAERVVLATGATDRPLPFAGGTLPGVFSGRALQILLNQHRVRPGRRVVVLGAGAEAAEVAADARLAGADVVAVFDPGDDWGAVVAEGRDGVEAVSLGGQRHAADVVAVAVGRQPDATLALVAGCAAGYAADRGGLVPVRDRRLGGTVPGILIAGDAAGVGEVADAFAEGTVAGLVAAVDLGFSAGDALATALDRLHGLAPDRLAPVAPLGQGDPAGATPWEPVGAESAGGPRAVVCRCEAVAKGEIVAAIAAGARTINDVKRRTRAGMGTCQGVYCVAAMAALLGHHAGIPPDRLDPMTARPPVRPIPLGAVTDSNG